MTNKSVAAAVISLFWLVLASVGSAWVGGNAPKGMAFDAAGNLFVANPDTGRIFKYAADASRTTFATGLVRPFSIAFDAAGNLFVAELQPDRKSGAILQFAPDGKRTTFASGLEK